MSDKRRGKTLITTVLTVAVALGMFLSQPKYNASDIVFRPEQKIILGEKPVSTPITDPQIIGALVTLDRMLSKAGMQIQDYEKIEIKRIPFLILVSATNLSKAEEEYKAGNFDYFRAISSIEYAFRAALTSRTFEIVLLQSPEGGEFPLPE